MSRAPSEKTLLAGARRQIRALEQQREEIKKEREAYRIRVTRAEQDLAEWKVRFDKLLQFRDAINSVASTP